MYDTDEVLYPKTDLKSRAKVDQLLDWNGNTVRNSLSGAYVAINVGPKLIHLVPPTDEVYDMLMHKVHNVLNTIDKLVDGNDFLIGDRFTIADIQIYNEVFNYQRFTGYTINEYENVQKWMQRVYDQEEIVRKLDSMFYEFFGQTKPPESPEVVLFGHYLSMPSRSVLYVLK